MHLLLWRNRKAASFKFSWAMSKTCCSLLSGLLLSLPPGFLMTLQISLTYLSVRTLSLWWLSSSYSLMSNLAGLGRNPNHRYISWVHMATFQVLIPDVCSRLFYNYVIHWSLPHSPLHGSLPLCDRLVWYQGPVLGSHSHLFNVTMLKSLHCRFTIHRYWGLIVKYILV